MTDLSGTERAQYVQRMFGRIAPRYDLLNRLMTLGQDIRWRREAVRHLEIEPGGLILDGGTGTGDLAFEVLRQHPAARVVASDFTAEMVALGRQRPGGECIAWVIADAQCLPFASDSFDGTLSGFLMRNVPDVDMALGEQQRVLKAGGRLVSLDTTPPRRNLLQPFIKFHLHYIVPLLGRIIAGDPEAYTYLPDSTEQFLTAEKLAERMGAAGFRTVDFVRRMFGTVAIHWGRKDS
ncbi:MAG: ubiquinone/menaquinone biosynthesis methyltransferase [Anaerolineales bacterium]|nr:ubiquinone/menaquinone biosynthesis methyltransferase [Anaerolineales bacterium]